MVQREPQPAVFDEAQKALVEQFFHDVRGCPIREKTGPQGLEDDKMMRPSDLGMGLQVMNSLIGEHVGLRQSCEEPQRLPDFSAFTGRKLSQHMAQRGVYVWLVERQPNFATIGQLADYVTGEGYESIHRA